MSGRQVSAAEFKAKCLRIIKEMQDTGESVTVTRRGRPVAVVSLPPIDRADAIVHRQHARDRAEV